MEKKSLLTLVNESNQIKNLLLESGGEITPEIEQALSVNEKSLAGKVDSYKFVIDDLDSFSELLKSKENEIKKARQSIESAVVRLKSNIKNTMIMNEINEVTGNDYVFKLKNAQPSLIITDENLIAKKYKYEVISTEIKKDELKQDLKNGLADSYGCELKENKSLSITINKGK